MVWTREDQVEAGRQGGAISAERRKQYAKARKADPLFTIKRNLQGHFKDLEAAARGTGPWKELPLSNRLAALLKVIEYGVGKPIGVDKQTKTPEAGSAEEGGGSEAASTVRFD